VLEQSQNKHIATGKEVQRNTDLSWQMMRMCTNSQKRDNPAYCMLFGAFMELNSLLRILLRDSNVDKQFVLVICFC
jgi:hypothetical protein